MLFRVSEDGQGLMNTDYPSCIYDKETLESMEEGGFTFEINGKPATIAQVLKAKKNSEEPSTGIETEAEVNIEAETKTKSKASSKTKAETKAKATTKTKVKTTADSDAKAKKETVSKTKTKTKTESEPDSKPKTTRKKTAKN